MAMKKSTRKFAVALGVLWGSCFILLGISWASMQWWHFPFFLTAFGVFAANLVGAMINLEDGE
jgi:hypothetical protein